MVRDIHDYDSLKKAYDDLLMFERFPGPAHSERVEEFVIQLKRDIREYIHRVSDSRVISNEIDNFIELVELPLAVSNFSRDEALVWFDENRSYRPSSAYGRRSQFRTTWTKLVRRRGRWYAYQLVWTGIRRHK